MSINACILSYNLPEVTSNAVTSALKFFPNPVLVHNGSLKQHVDHLKKRFPEVRHIVIEKNCGYSGGVNKGLEECFRDFEWTLFLSNDCEILSAPAVPSERGAIAPIIYRRKIQFVDSAGGGFAPSRGKLIHFRSTEDFLLAKQRGWIPYLPGSAFLLHKTTFEKTGGMDVSLGTYWDDVDWSVRAQRAGFPIRVDETFCVLHRVGKTCHKNPLYSIYYFQRNRKRISWKYCPPYLRVKLVASLTKDWIKLGSKLVRQRRFRDLVLLKSALFD